MQFVRSAMLRAVMPFGSTTPSAQRQELANRLNTAGCDVVLTGTDWHTAGDFTAPSPPGDGRILGRRVPSQAVQRPALDFDLHYVNKGGNRLDKLQVINRGTEIAYEVTVTVPKDAGLSLVDSSTIPKIPGGGKLVTIDVMNQTRGCGGPISAARSMRP